jgi:glycosyltransferase involved in cell wall biosynthesis
MKALFLCTELAGYFSNCISLLHKSHPVEIKVVLYPRADSAPFDIHLAGIELIDRRDLSGDKLVAYCMKFEPDIVYVAGWIDRDYKRIARKLKLKGKVIVCGLDNEWKGTLRQRLACLLSNILIKPYFDILWVAGQRQYQFARHLGFSHDKILCGLYAADVEAFSSVATHPRLRRLIYVGRFENVKGISLLYNVFVSLTDEERNGWSLAMIGNGSLKKTLLPTSTISIHDFMQPHDLVNFIADAGAFILPSREEPWGVVVQEFAAAGKPLMLSSAVNAGEQYLIHGYNGLRFQKGDLSSLKTMLIRFFKQDDLGLQEMGQRSAEMALRGAPKYWVANFLSLVR